MRSRKMASHAHCAGGEPMLGNKNQSHRGGRGIGKDERQGVPKQPYEGNRIPFLFSRAEWPHREWFPAQPCIEGSVFQHSLAWPLCRARLPFVRLLHGSRRPNCRFSRVSGFFSVLRRFPRPKPNPNSIFIKENLNFYGF